MAQEASRLFLEMLSILFYYSFVSLAVLGLRRCVGFSLLRGAGAPL